MFLLLLLLPLFLFTAVPFAGVTAVVFITVVIEVVFCAVVYAVAFITVAAVLEHIEPFLPRAYYISGCQQKIIQPE